MIAGFQAVGLALALTAAAAPSAPEGRRAEPVASLVSVLSAEDYPDEAVRKREQGTVSFRLSVDSDGRVTGCDILASSRSATLDSTTCRLMTERARFHPAADAVGKPTADTYEGRLVWRLPDPSKPRIDLPQRASVAIGLWSACADGEAAKLAVSSLAAAEIGERAFQACRALEERFLREIAEAKVEMDAARFDQALRADYSARLGRRLDYTRGILDAPKK